MTFKDKYPHAHEEVRQGFYHGIHNDVNEMTGISKPVINRALCYNEIDTPKKLQALEAALEIIRLRKNKVA